MEDVPLHSRDKEELDESILRKRCETLQVQYKNMVKLCTYLPVAWEAIALVLWNKNQMGNEGIFYSTVIAALLLGYRKKFIPWIMEKGPYSQRTQLLMENMQRRDEQAVIEQVLGEFPEIERFLIDAMNRATTTKI